MRTLPDPNVILSKMAEDRRSALGQLDEMLADLSTDTADAPSRNE